MTFRRFFSKASVEFLRTGFCACALCFVLLSLSRAQEANIIRSVEIRGNNHLSTSTILETLALDSGVRYTSESLSTALDRLIERYALDGYLHAAIDSVSVQTDDGAASVSIVIALEEGKPTMIQEIGFNGHAAFDLATLQASFGVEEGERWSAKTLEQGIRRVLELYERKGFPFATVTIARVDVEEEPESHVAALVLRVDEGQSVRLEELTVTGNTTTRTDVIVRAARFKAGALYSSALPPLIQRRLERLLVFSSVSVPQLYVKPDGTGGLHVDVREGSPNRFDGIVGYVPSAGPHETGYFTGLIDISLRNLFGTARQLSTRWFRETQSTHEIGLRYREPWAASLPLDVEVAFFQRKQDSTFVRRMYELSADAALGDEVTIGGVVTQASVVPTELPHVPIVVESRTRSAGVFLHYDGRDNAVTPTAGVLYRTQYQAGIKQRSLGSVSRSNSTQHIALRLEYYLSVLDGQVAMASLNLRDVRVADIEHSDLLRIGGAATLRGYFEGQFVGSRALWGTVEYRVLLGDRSFAYAFLDGARIETPASAAVVGFASATKFGYGAGARLETPVGLIGVSIALGAGESFENAKLHVRIANEF